MAIGDARRVCAGRFAEGSEDYWRCVQEQHCGVNPNSFCQLSVWLERVTNPNPVGHDMGLAQLKPEVLDMAQRLAADLKQPNARISATRTLQLAEAIQTAGLHTIALQGMEVVNQIEAGRAQPRAEIMTRLNDLQGVSRAALDRAVGSNLTQ